MSEQYPNDLRYTQDHEWAKLEENSATIGITFHAQEALGEVVFVDLPEVGQTVSKGDTFGAVESIKAVSDLYAPLSGTITEVNSDLQDNPGLVNSDPYTGAWMIKLEPSSKEELDALMDVKSYEEFVSSL